MRYYIYEISNPSIQIICHAGVASCREIFICRILISSVSGRRYRFVSMAVTLTRDLQTRSRSYVTTCRLQKPLKPALLFLLRARRCAGVSRMHVTVASERLSLDNYTTAPGACGGAASSAARTSMHGIKSQRRRHFVFEKERSITAYHLAGRESYVSSYH